MRFLPTALDGVILVAPEPHADARGSFSRTFCAEEFARAGLPPVFVQCNVSSNQRRGTLRGLHYQDQPHPEGKLVRCTRGALFDVAVDLRPGSASLHRWVGVELRADSLHALWIPPGFANGFVTLLDDTDVLYQMTEPFHPDLARGLRWDDPALGIAWPVADPVLSARDANLPLLDDRLGRAARGSPRAGRAV